MKRLPLILLAVAALSAQTPAPPQFEVASIKPNTSPERSATWNIAGSGRFNGENIPVEFLVMTAFRLRDFQVTGIPHWIESEKYDIEAKAEGAPSQDQLFTMLQGLLADRFKFRYHMVKKKAPVYTLTTAKKGILLKPSRPEDCAMPVCGRYFAHRGQIDGTGIHMAQFIVAIENGLERPVIDRTGFTGLFDVHLTWAPEIGNTDQPGDDTGPSIFTAIQEQLGLKLQAARAPVDVLVIDHIEKPSSN